MNFPITSFNTGEVTPLIDARSDVDKYARACRRLENMIPLVYGAAQRRPGTKYIGTAKNSPDTARLIPFVYSAEIAYPCEFGNRYIRFYYGESLLEDGGAPVEVVTPYPESDLASLQYNQIGDVMWIVHPSHAPMKLSRTTATSFTLEKINFTQGPFLTRNDIQNDDGVTLSSDVTTKGDTGILTASAALFEPGHAGTIWKLTQPRVDTVTHLSLSATGTSTAIDVKGSWTFNTHGIWNATVLIQRNENDNGWETYRTYIGPDRNVQLTTTEDVDNVQYRISVESYTSGTVDADLTVNSPTQFGIVRIDSVTSGTTAEITVLTKVPATDTTKRWAEGAWSDVRGYPAAIAFYESRVIYAGTAYSPQAVWLSEVDDYDDFEEGTSDADSFSITLTTTNDIRWIESLDAIAVGTAGDEWQITSNKLYAPITPTNFSARRQTTNGSTDIQGIRANNSILFVDYVGRKVRELAYSEQEGTFAAPDMTELAEYITESGVVGMAYQRSPTQTLWAVRADGALLSLSYEREQGVVAWARHLTGQVTASVDTVTKTYWANPISDYEITYISTGTNIYGVPLNYIDRSTLSLSGDARNVGGGIVGLSAIGHPFASGQLIYIMGTTNYDGAHTLTDETSEDELQFADTFVAETFGASTVVQYIAGTGGNGAMAQDANGALYRGRSVHGIEKITNYGMTSDSTIFTPTGGWPATIDSMRGIEVSSDDSYLYVWYSDKPSTHDYYHDYYIVKFNISDGAPVWSTKFQTGVTVNIHGYDMCLDRDDNVYILDRYTWCGVLWLPTISKFAAADGTRTTFLGDAVENDIHENFAIVIDEDIDRIVVGGFSYNSDISGSTSAGLYNLWSMMLNGADNRYLALGGIREGVGGLDYSTHTIGKECLLVHDGYIYALADDSKLYKLSEYLDIVAQVDVPANAVGIFVDTEDHIVLITQDAVTPQSDIFWFYDKDLNYLSSVGNFYTDMLSEWGIDGDEEERGNVTFGKGVIPRYASSTTTADVIRADVVGSVAVIPGDAEDEVWISITRNTADGTAHYIEKMQPREFDSQEDCFYVDSGVQYDGVATTTITGLEHLEGQEVAILGDGAVFPTQTVSGGCVTLTEAVSKASVGLPFTYAVKPMRLDVAGQETSQGSIKRVSELVLSFYKTLNARYGPNEDALFDIPWRTDENLGEPPDLFTGMKVVSFDGGFSIEDPILITGSDPLPCTLRSIVARVDKTGR